MKAIKTDYGFLLKIESGEEVISSITGFCEEQGLGAGVMLGLGAVRDAELAYYNPETKEYETRLFDEQMEVVSFLSNIAMEEGKVLLHPHCTLGRKDFSLIGGHLIRAEAKPVLETHIFKDSTSVKRALDTGINLKALDLD
ncbi:MAG: PPC domain-containing DNA-binding protein [archaeon]